MANYNISLDKVQSYPKGIPYATVIKYEIKYSGNLPAGARLYLVIGKAENRLEITGGWDATKHIPLLLKCFRYLGKWAQDVDCWLTIEVNGFDPNLPISNTMPIRTVVQPLEWPTNTDKIYRAAPQLTYPGNGWGRCLSKLYDGVRYFYVGGYYEVDPVRRGFDCTTFPESLFVDFLPGEKYPDISVGNAAPIIANALGATKADMEGLNQDAFRDAIGKAKDGAYMVWKHYEHVLLCRVDSYVGTIWFHQFTNGGYKRSLLADTTFSGTYTARLLPMKMWSRVWSYPAAGAQPGNNGGKAIGVPTSGGTTSRPNIYGRLQARSCRP